jgi:hypothetical protein
LTLLDKTKFFCHIPQAIVWDACPDNGRELQLTAAFDNTRKIVNAAFTEDGIDWCVSVSWAVSTFSKGCLSLLSVFEMIA